MLQFFTFLKDKFQLEMNNDAQQSTTKYGTTLDAVFSRFFDKINSKTFISYFSYHKPIVSFIESKNEDACDYTVDK